MLLELEVSPLSDGKRIRVKTRNFWKSLLPKRLCMEIMGSSSAVCGGETWRHPQSPSVEEAWASLSEKRAGIKTNRRSCMY